ncbi:MAG: TonB-dependent receptor [Pseudomonadota bacterium]
MKQKTLASATALAAAGLTGAGLAPAAHAQGSLNEGGALEEIIVTAERRSANLQDIPVAMTSYSGDDLEALQANDIGDLQALVPNLSVHVGDANNAVVYIRGVGQIDSIAFFEPGVGIYLDDIYLGRAQGAFLDVVDVERIEVLRGPQGSLYGRNTVGGAIKYVSAQPTDEFSGNVSAMFGNFGRANLKATLSGPIGGDSLTGRITAAQLSRDGYADNAFDGNDDGDQNTFFARGALDWQAAETVSVQLSADFTDSDPDRSRTPSKVTPISVLTVDPFTFGLSTTVFPADADPFEVNADFNRVEQTETQGIGLNATWDVTDALTLKSISSYRELDYGTEIDLDGTPVNAFGIFYFNDQTQVSQEFQVTYSGDRASLVGGVYYFNEDGDTFDGGVFNNLLIGLSGVAEFSTDSTAVFGQLDYEFSDRLTGIFGLRYTDEEKDYARTVEDIDLTALAGIMFDPVTGAVSYSNPELLNPSSADLPVGVGVGVQRPPVDPESATFDNFSFKAGLKYRLGDDMQLFGTVSEGFKSGGFNGRAADAQSRPYDEETLLSYELGIKSEWLGNRLRLNGSLFLTEYEDLQVSSFEAAPGGGGILPIFTNAGEASIAGLELELMAVLSDRTRLMANLGYLDAEYDEFLTADPVTNELVDVSDQRELVNAPEWDAFVGLSHAIPLSAGTLTFAADVGYRSKTYLEVNSSENLAQDGYAVSNASITFESADSRWRVMLGGKNLGDKEYRTHAFDLSAFPGVELGYYNAPRTYSLAGTYQF